ncbi:hypothetical protein [Epilithonimonas sp.]|uniref:hypothetical protein n=1 Tax=Epilithonimonas sp. TaxID=2894511 RepID=UPI0035B42D47
MTKYLFLIFPLCFSSRFIAQTKQQTETSLQNRQAEFPGGENAFRNEFMKMVHGYFDITAYAVNGQFSFIITIDENGKPSELQIYPKVKNDEEFRQDMTFAMKRMKKKWKPAIKDGVAISSNRIIEINFSSDHADHGE